MSLQNAALERIHNLSGNALGTNRGGVPTRGSASLGLSEREISRYSLARAIDEIRPGAFDKRSNSFEWECHDELKKRGFTISPDSIAVPNDVLEHRTMDSPSYLVGASAPAGLSLIDMLRNSSIAYRLGAQRLTGLQNDVKLPRVKSDPSVTWIGPGGFVSANDPDIGQILASPKTAVTITELSEQLLKQSDGETIIKRILAGALSIGIDKAVIDGAGGVEPLGILNTPGIGTASGAAVTHAVLVGAQKTVADANGVINPESLGYAASPAVAELLALRQRFSNTDTPLWKGALHDGEIAGVRAVASKQIPAATLLYGDWSNVYICEFGPLMLAADNGGTRWNELKVGIRAMWMVDVFLSAPSAFVKVGGLS